MSKTCTIVIGLATALVALNVSAPAPIHAQERPTIRASFFGPGASTAGVTVRDPVLLTATAPQFQPGWTLQIVGKRQRPNPTVIASGSAAEVEQRVFSNVPGTFTFWAILYRGAGFAPLPSAPITVVWVEGESRQLIVEAQGGRIRAAVNYTLNPVVPGALASLTENGRCWTGGRPCPNGKDDQRASPPGVDWVVVPFATPINVRAWVNQPLPEAWDLVIRNGAGATLCGPARLQCNAATPPPTDAISVFICRHQDGWCGALRVDIKISFQ